jgi:hypothetical protein
MLKPLKPMSTQFFGNSDQVIDLLSVESLPTIELHLPLYENPVLLSSVTIEVQSALHISHCRENALAGFAVGLKNCGRNRVVHLL